MLENFFITSPNNLQFTYSTNYDLSLVFISIFVAIFSSCCVFEIIERFSKITSRLLWLTTCSIILGVGVWVMHFLGMIALKINCSISYDSVVTVLSSVPSIISAAIVLNIVTNKNVSFKKLFFAGGVLTLGVGVMHFLGMSAIELDGILRYEPKMLMLAVAVSTTITILSLCSKSVLEKFILIKTPFVTSIICGTLLGVSISTMHYVAMNATYFLQFHPNNNHPVIVATAPEHLTIAVVCVTVFLLLSSLGLTFLGAKISRINNRLNAILAATSQGFIVLDNDGLITECNKAMANLIDTTQSDLIGQFYSALLTTENGGVIKDNSQKQIQLQKKDGSLLDCIVYENEVKDNDGNTLYSFALFSDISRRIKIEKDLQIANENYIALLEKQIELNQENEDLYNNAPCGYHSVDKNGVIVKINNTELNWLGYSREEVVGKMRSHQFYSSVSQALYLSSFSEFVKTGNIENLEFELICKNGEIKTIHLNATAIRDSEGNFLRSRSILHDVSELKKTQNELHRLTVTQQAMLDNEFVGIIKTQNHIITWKNKAANLIFGYEGDELLKQSTSILHFNHDDFLQFGDTFYSTVKKSGDYYRTEHKYRRKDGEERWMDISGTLLSEETQEFLWMMVDNTERKLYHEKVEHIAFHDNLTGLPNRALLFDRLEQDLAHSKRMNQILAVCYLDLDGFKPVNDKFGHEAGDSVLMEIANRMQKTIRASDTAARLGGDEFALVLCDSNYEDYRAILQRVIDSINCPISLNSQQKVKVGASIGVVFYPENGDSVNMLMQYADKAMYQAKQSGKNRIYIHGE